jgi:hypothetical protein
MSKRLNQLTHQKQLLEEHLRWLDQEIANESGQKNSLVESGIPPTEEAATPLLHVQKQSSFEQVDPVKAAAFDTGKEIDETEILSEQLISQYAHVSSRREMDPRMGLILFFGGILGFLALTVFLVYWFGYR